MNRLFYYLKRRGYLSESANPESGLGFLAALAIVGVSFVGAWLFGNKVVSDAALDFLAGLVQFVNSYTIKLLQLSGDFLNYVLSPAWTSKTLTADPVYVQMWANVRDLTNMLIVLGFVFVGIATTLRWQEYGAKKLLPPLIAVAVLINFSGLICNTIYDTANIVQNAFLTNGGSGGIQALTSGIERNILAADNQVKTVQQKDQQVLTAAAASAFNFFIILAGSAVFTILAILLSARWAILVVLYILSPLAMFCFVFPPLKEWWKKWWGAFFHWSFIGVVAAFLIYLAASVFPSNTTGQIDSSELFISFVFIFLAYKFARSGSAIGSTAILSAATGVAGYAAGRIGSIAGKGALAAGAAGVGMADKAAGGKVQGFAQRISGTYGRALEKIGARGTGQTAAAQAARVANEEKDLKAAYNSGNENDKLRVQALARTRNDARGAAAMKIVTEEGDLGDTFKATGPGGGLDINAARSRIKYAQQFGIGDLMDKASKSNPNLAESHENLVKAVRKAAPSKVAEWHESTMTPEVFAALGKNQLIEIGKRGSPQLVEKAKRYGDLKSSEYKALYNHVNATHGSGSATDKAAKKRVRSLYNEINKPGGIFA